MVAKLPIKSVACVGEVMIELIAKADGVAQVGVAGDTFNTAVYLVRALAGSDVSVSYITALGSDPYSQRILKAIQDYGLKANHVESREGMMPGLYAIDTDADGERSFSYWRSASAARTLFTAPCDVELEKLNYFDLVFLSGITMAILPPNIRSEVLAWANRYRAAGGTLAYDSNYRPHLWECAAIARTVNSEMWARADIALPSIDDEMSLFGDPNEAAVVARLADIGAQNGALKRGAMGPLNLSDGSVLSDLPSVPRVIDSTAAGDSFNAAYLSAIVHGHAPIKAMRDGHHLASRVIQAPGAIVDI